MISRAIDATIEVLPAGAPFALLPGVQHLSTRELLELGEDHARLVEVRWPGHRRRADRRVWVCRPGIAPPLR